MIRLMKGTQSFFKQCQSILRTLVNHSNSWPFRCPVEKAEVPDYYETIKDPIGNKYNLCIYNI